MRPPVEPQPGATNQSPAAENPDLLPPSDLRVNSDSTTSSLKWYVFGFVACVAAGCLIAFTLGLMFATLWGGIVLLGVAMFPGKGWARKRGQAKGQERTQDMLATWRQAVKDRAALMDQYATLRINPVAALEHSLLWDERHPQSLAFTEAYTKVTDLKPGKTAELPESETEYERFVSTVTSAKQAFDAAVASAKEKGLEAFDGAERANALRAKELLITAFDETAENTARSLAAARATVMLATLRSISLPNEMRMEIDTVRKMVNSGAKVRPHHETTIDV